MIEPTATIRGTFRTLLDVHGPQSWWPGDSSFEMMVGAILTQNTSWTNAEYALGNLKRNEALSPARILDLHPDRLAAMLRPSGYYNLKSHRLRALSTWLLSEGGQVRLNALETDALRKSLLQVKGIGPETADVILLYAFGRPVFVVDAYAKRIFSRVGVIRGDEEYEPLRLRFESMLEFPATGYNEFHALIVRHAKEVCRKTPLCDTCGLSQVCAHATRIKEVKQ